MKNILKKLVCVFITVAIAVSCVACGGDGLYDDDENNGKVDTHKTQLYVGLMPGGHGNTWLYSAISRFEKKYANYRFETGKEGVQVMVDDVPSGGLIASNLPTGRYQVIYTSDLNLHDLASRNLIYNMDDIANEKFDDVDSEGNAIKVSIADKFINQEQKENFSYNNKIYALPYVSSDDAISYDRDLFEEKGLFFLATDPENNNYEAYYEKDGGNKVYQLGKPSEYTLSMGRDGISGTYDDGLPATYEQFFFLVKKLCDIGCTPITWTGMHIYYLYQMLYALWASNEGATNMKLNYSFNGVANDLIASFDVDGNPVLKGATTITEENGYELQNQVGKFYAVDFLYKIIKLLKENDVRGYNMAFKEDIDHLNAQDNFLKSGQRSKRDSTQYKRIAMFHDGQYWENEATATFTQMGEGYGKLDRKIGWMPYPHPTIEGEGNTIFFGSYTNMMFINGNIDSEHIDVAKKFVQFMHTRESLVEFSTMTSMIQPYDFEITEAERQKMSYFGQNIYDKFKAAVQSNNFMDPMSDNNIFRTNYAVFDLLTSSLWRTSGYGLNSTDSPKALRNTDSVTYFKAMQSYFTESWWNNNILKK